MHPREDLPNGLSDILVAPHVQVGGTLCQDMSEGEAFGPRLGSTAEPICASGLLEVDESRLRRSLDIVIDLPAENKANTRGAWDILFQLLGAKLTMSTAGHPQTDGQTERVIACSKMLYGAPRSWSDQLPMVEFALNNAVHASTGFTPFYLNGLRHPKVPLTLRGGTVGERLGNPFQVSDSESESLKRQLSSFLDGRLMLISHRRNGIGPGQTKEYSDNNCRGNLTVFIVGDLILLDTKNLPLTLVRSVVSNNLKHHSMGAVGALNRHGAAYTIDLRK
ncbi:LOW QUALITY PROTEIN: Pol protein [Phytophthora palmivora]|uniref:Pol protein n=1 Tax=Phytophthora palmivora TaxID=4796 RepID=A0A2P4X6P4_9STRA|nr:LOW QUALITY PROTEIN: Pol protein [Phytophthora palmivora]